MTPDAAPSATPDAAPSETPDAAPSETPDAAPSMTSDAAPTMTPDAATSMTPVAAPSETPDAAPSVTPGAAPSENPDAAPSATTDAALSVMPYAAPSVTPDAATSVTPDAAPSETPYAAPCDTLDAAPSVTPYAAPSVTPDVASSVTPDAAPRLSPVATHSETMIAAFSVSPELLEGWLLMLFFLRLLTLLSVILLMLGHNCTIHSLVHQCLSSFVKSMTKNDSVGCEKTWISTCLLTDQDLLVLAHVTDSCKGQCYVLQGWESWMQNCGHNRHKCFSHSRNVVRVYCFWFHHMYMYASLVCICTCMHVNVCIPRFLHMSLTAARVSAMCCRDGGLRYTTVGMTPLWTDQQMFFLYLKCCLYLQLPVPAHVTDSCEGHFHVLQGWKLSYDCCKP